MVQRYQTTHWQRIRNPDLTRDPGFARHLREIARPKQIAFQRLMSAYDGEPIGAECKARTREAWAFVVPDMSGSEYAFRVQYFDEDGFSGHDCHASLVKAVEDMLGQGYLTLDAGALDRCASTVRWALGVKRAGIRMKFNCGQISFQQMLEEMQAVTA